MKNDLATGPEAMSVLCATVEDCREGYCQVRIGSASAARLLPATILVTSAVPVTFEPGDLVMCVADSEKLVVLGKVPVPAPSGAVEQQPSATPDTLVLEAKTSLTLKVGDGSITIREDGTILIKGKDLVSHAKRRNRIRGGSVEIN